MEAANRGACDVGAASIGFNIQLPREQEPNPYSTPELTFQFHSFAMRKMHLAMRAGGGGVSRRLRHARRIVRGPHAGADAQGPLDSPGLRRPQLLDAGHQFPRTPSRRGDLAGGFVAAAVRRGCGGSLARAGQQYRRSGGPCSRALSSETRALIEPASRPISARRTPYPQGPQVLAVLEAGGSISVRS